MSPLCIQGGAAQEALGERLGGILTPPLLVGLEGDLGAGKTTLVRGMLRGFGHRGRVVSPTYTLVETYRPGPFPIHHLDLYRLGDPEELVYLGLDDLCDGSGILLVEWPERGSGVLPEVDLCIRIHHFKQARELKFEAQTLLGKKIAEKIRAALNLSED